MTKRYFAGRQAKVWPSVSVEKQIFDPPRYGPVSLGRETENPGFVLNRAPYRAAKILITGANFGCGSSREHAVWALTDFGIRCLIGPSFADIFSANCANNGVLLVTLPVEICSALAKEADGRSFRVDLEAGMILAPSGKRYEFSIDGKRREKLIGGIDAIVETTRYAPELKAFEARDQNARPWLRH